MKFATQISPLHNFINFIISLGQQAHWVKIEREYSGSLPRKGPVVYWLGKRSTLTFWFGNGAWRDQQQQKNSYISFWQRCLKRPTTKKTLLYFGLALVVEETNNNKKTPFFALATVLEETKKNKKLLYFSLAMVLECANIKKNSYISFCNSAWRDQQKQKNSYISFWQQCLKRPKTTKELLYFSLVTVLEETNNNKKTLIFRFGNGAWRDQQQQKNFYISVWQWCLKRPTTRKKNFTIRLDRSLTLRVHIE